MNAYTPAPLPPRVGTLTTLTTLILLHERARRERIITLDPTDWRDITPPAHVVDALQRGRNNG